MLWQPTPGILPGISGDAWFLTNEEGFRADEMPPPLKTTRHVLAIGGSTTQCLYLDQSEAWPALLQEKIKAKGIPIWVGNAGASGRSTRQHVLQLQYILPQYPQIDTVMMLVGINDLVYRLAQDTQYDPHGLKNPAIYQEMFSNAFSEWPADIHPWLSWYKRSALWQLLSRARKKLFPTRIILQKENGSQYKRWRLLRQNALRLQDELPDLTSGVQEYADNLNQMIDFAKSHSLRLIFMTQPTLWKADLAEKLKDNLWLGWIGPFQGKKPMVYYTVRALSEGMERYNSALLQVCKKRQVECIDLAALLPKDMTTFYDDEHFNETGAARVAEILAEYLETGVSLLKN